MEWVETTGKTLEEAKDAALDQLGVDEHDAEFEVLEEPRTGLFGRVRGEARVRARVTPRVHRPKQERRRSKGGGSRRESASGAANGQRDGGSRPTRPPKKASPSRNGKASQQATTNVDEIPKPASVGEGKAPMEDSVTVEEQAEIMEEFLAGLLDAFGATGEVSSKKVDDETIEIEVNGEDLGLLIGPKGLTLQAVQDMARTVVQRQAAGHHEGRVRVDIGGYRQRRREALARFASQIAEQVRNTGEAKSLEPMNAADRKVVHDTVNDIAGVHTRSDGQDPDRWVVILPADA